MKVIYTDNTYIVIGEDGRCAMYDFSELPCSFKGDEINRAILNYYEFYKVKADRVLGFDTETNDFKTVYERGGKND